MLTSAAFRAPSPGPEAADGPGQPPGREALARKGSVARSDAIAKLRRAASQREMRTKPAAVSNPGLQDAGDRPMPAHLPTSGSADSQAAVQSPSPTQPQLLQSSMQPQQQPQLTGALGSATQQTLQGADGQVGPDAKAEAGTKDADVASSNIVGENGALVDPTLPPHMAEQQSGFRLPGAFLLPPGQPSPASLSPLDNHSRNPDTDYFNDVSSSARSLSPMTALRDRAVARSPLPSLEQLRARILHEREAAGLQRSASTSAASQAARAYALEKLLGTSGTDRLYDHSRDGTLIERGAATPSPTLANSRDMASDGDDEGMASDGVLSPRSPRRDRASLRRSRTIGGLSAMAERQRKAAFVEGVFLAVPGANSNRLSRARQQIQGLRDSTLGKMQHSVLPATIPPSTGGNNDDDVPLGGEAPAVGDAVTRSLSQRQIARTEMMRKLSTRGRAASSATTTHDPPQSQPPSAPSSLSPSPLPFASAIRLASGGAQRHEALAALGISQTAIHSQQMTSPFAAGLPSSHDGVEMNLARALTSSVPHTADLVPRLAPIQPPVHAVHTSVWPDMNERLSSDHGSLDEQTVDATAGRSTQKATTIFIDVPASKVQPLSLADSTARNTADSDDSHSDEDHDDGRSSRDLDLDDDANEEFYGLYGPRDGESEDEGSDDGPDNNGRSPQATESSSAQGNPQGILSARDRDDHDHVESPLAQGAVPAPASRESFRRTGDVLKSTPFLPEIQTSGFNGGSVPSTSPTRLSFRHPASVPYDTSPANELELDNLRKSSFMTISPSGINVPFHFFDHEHGSQRASGALTHFHARGQSQDEWPLSVDSSGTLTAGRESADVGRSSGGDSRSGGTRLSVDQTSGNVIRGGKRNIGDDASERDSSDTARTSSLLEVPSLHSRPSDRLNAIFGSSFVREYARDLDFDATSKSSSHDAGSEDERGSRIAADDFQANRGDSDTDSLSSDREIVFRQKAPSRSEQSDNASTDELDDDYLRKVDRMAEKLGRLTRKTRSQRLAGHAAPLHQPTIQGREQARYGELAPLQQVDFTARDLPPQPSSPPLQAAQNAAIEPSVQAHQQNRPRTSSEDAAIEILSQSPGRPQDDARFPSAAPGDAERPSQSSVSQSGSVSPAAPLPRRMHAQQASIDSLISVLDAGGALNAQTDLSHAASARTAVRVPFSLQTATSVAAPVRPAPPTSFRPELASLLANDKLAPFPGLVQKTSAGRFAANGHDEAAHLPPTMAAGDPASAEGSRSQSRQHQANGTLTPAPAIDPSFANPTATRTGGRADRPPVAKQGNFLTSLRRKASGAFVGTHGRSGSKDVKDGFWSRKASIKRSNSSAKTGDERDGHVLKIEHPHHVGGPVQIISPWRPEVSGGSPASVSSTGGSPDLLQVQGPFSASSSRFREILEDGRADAEVDPDVSTATASSATASLAPETIAMVRRYSRMLTAKEAPHSVPGLPSHATHDPPRKLTMDEPVFQVISATTIKDRYLFLFSDILVIAKPVIASESEGVDGRGTGSTGTTTTTVIKMKGAAVLPDIRWTFSVKNILELSRIRTSVTASSKPPPAKSRANNPTLLAFVDQFNRNPDDALRTLVARTKFQSSSASIAQLLYQTPELDRAMLTAYLTDPSRRELLAAYIAQHRLVGVSIESGLRSLLLELRFPHDVTSFEAVLILFARRWVACNAALVKPGFTFELASDLVFAIMALNDALHSALPGSPELQQTPRPAKAITPGFFSEPCRSLSKDDFLQVFRQHDPDGILSDRTLGRIYLSVRSEPIAQALTSDGPRHTIRIKGGQLPTRLTYGQASEPVTLCIPAADADLAIRLYAQDTTFEPAILTFGRSREASFTMTSKSLGQKQVIFVRAGRNARFYTGTELDDRRNGQLGAQDVVIDVPLPRTLNVIVERAFMKHSFNITSHASDGAKRHFMLSFESEVKMRHWLDAIDQASAEAIKARELGVGGGGEDPSAYGQPQQQDQRAIAGPRVRRAADAIALQVLREALIAREEAPASSVEQRGPGLSRSATVQVPTLSIPRGSNAPSSTSPLDRQASTSRHYYAGGAVGQHERDFLIPSSVPAATSAEARVGGDGRGTAVSPLPPVSRIDGGGGGHTKGVSSLSYARLASGHRANAAAATVTAQQNACSAGTSTGGSDNGKTMRGEAIVAICRQNSLLPLVLAHLDAFGGGGGQHDRI